MICLCNLALNIWSKVVLIQLLWCAEVNQNLFIGTIMGKVVAYGMGNELKIHHLKNSGYLSIMILL